MNNEIIKIYETIKNLSKIIELQQELINRMGQRITQLELINCLREGDE